MSATVQPPGTGSANDSPAAADAKAPRRVTLFRIVPASQADRAFVQANGSREGRWTSAQTPVIYASLSSACALLEFLAHLERPPDETLYLVEATAPASSLREVGPLPDDWNQRPYRAHVQAIGDAWAQAGLSLALRVPSALSPRECNVLINTAHPDLSRIDPVGREPVVIDPRLHGAFTT